MGREIKFRAWDKETRSWTKNIPVHIDVDGRVVLPTRNPSFDIALMQFTGLKDKNGKEIYEGDLLSISRRSELPCEVIWKDNRMMITWKSGRAGPMYSGVMGGVEVEIIGNIYENPDLLPTTNNLKGEDDDQDH